MNKIIVTISILLVAVFSVAYLYFSNLSVGSKTNDKALSLIPESAGLIFSFKNDKAYYEIFKDYKLFDAILGSKNKEELSAVKQYLLDYSNLRLISSGQNIFLSFHPQKSDSIAFLWTIPLIKEVDNDDLMQYLNQNKGTSAKWIDGNGVQIAEINLKKIKKLFYLYVNKGIASGSFSKDLLLQITNTTVPKISAGFITEINSGGLKNENSPANIFINRESSKEFISSFFRQKNPGGNFNLLNNLSGFTTLNMNYKSDALMFNGITTTDTSKPAYLNLFLHQKAAKNPVTKIVPENTAYFIAYGLSDYRRFARDLKAFHKKRNELAKLDNQISLITKETGIHPNRDIQKYWGNEFITFQLSNGEKLGAVKLTNGRQMQFFLQPLSSEYSESIWRMNYSGLFYNYFGDPFKLFDAPFYTIIDNYLIMSNSPGSVQNFLSSYSLGRQLYKTPKFEEFNRLVADQSNILVFIHVKNSGDNINSLLKSSYAKTIKSSDYGFKDFYGLSYQLSSDGDHFFTNFYAGSKQLVEPEVKQGSIPDSILVN
jgi:hypothetical protein